ncbi:ribosomal protein L7/L12 [Kovacikia minuta CCNUW1]|uniref:bL12 family ribosomal protein n=1 Tax=Kovacikia minuta TaxID=2931930 RepID=UPI001CCB3458|nr:bL12 family ribosomal protein [Kovacikia minuta]UBF25212.1 ribosomal protein L7/L12 [Kovacikia minuta CCNUW1]
MKFVKKVSAGVLLAFGIPVLLIGLIGGVAEKDSKEKIDLIAGSLIIGMPPTVLGGWLVRSLFLQHEREERDRLQSAFFKLLKQGNGRVTTLAFAMETGLDGEAAKAYLNKKAREFIANFDVDADGDMSYRFDVDSLNLLQMEQPISASATVAQGPFDVILETVPDSCKIGAIKVVRELTHLGLKEAKDLVEATPIKLREGVNENTAQECRQKLEAIGATVMVIEN